MKTHRPWAIFTAALLAASSGWATSPSTLAIGAKGGESTLDSAVGAADGAIELRASKDSSTASLRIGRTLSNAGPDQGRFTTFALTASAPVNKNDDNTTLATLDGFANAFTLELKLTRFLVPKRSYLPMAESARFQAAIAAGASRLGKPVPTNGVSLATLEEFAPDLAPELENKLWDVNARQHIMGLSATIGHKEFKYLEQPSLNDGKTSKIPYGVQAFYAIAPASSPSLWTFGVEYQNAFKDAKSKGLLAPPDASGVQEVKTGPIGPPQRDDKKLVFVEMRRLVSVGSLGRQVGVAVKATYDAQEKIFGVDVPIMLVRDDKGNLTGGIELGWQDKNHTFTVGVIVGGAFTLFQ